MELNVIVTIVSLAIAIYFLYKRYVTFDKTPDKEFLNLIKNFNKQIKVEFDVQTKKLELIVFKSVLMGENLLVLSLTNKTDNKLLIANTTLHNRGYDPNKQEFLLLSKEVLDSATNINISIFIWLTKDLAIRYEIYNN
jgi:hypothetical protein